MGNVLCKKRRNDSPMSPVDRVIGRCAQICPQSIVKKKPFWDKQVFETSPPPLSQQPKMNNFDNEQRQNGWESATLKVPDVTDGPPVAPPRKKRPSMSPKNEAPRKLEQLLDKTQSEEGSSDASTSSEVNSSAVISAEGQEVIKNPPSPTKVVPHIGNRKSDKFFGENIADSLAPEEKSPEKEVISSIETHPTEETDSTKTDPKDEVDAETKCRIEEPEVTEEMLRQINKETGNLIFAMERQCKKECTDYKGQDPVEEAVIVPVKRKPRHICDEEDALYKCLHSLDPKAPKKPQRDFTKYKKNLDNNKSQEKNESSLDQPLKDVTKAKVRDCEPLDFSLIKNAEVLVHAAGEGEKSPSTFSETETIPADEIALLTPPPIPPKMKHIKKTSLASNISEPTERPESVSTNMSNSEKILRRCLSTQSYLTPDLVDKIAEQANSLSLSALYLPEDYTNQANDGSGSVSPNCKLTEKRKGLSPQVSRVDQETYKTGKSETEKLLTETDREKTVDEPKYVPQIEVDKIDKIDTADKMDKVDKPENLTLQVTLQATSQDDEKSSPSVSRLNSEEGRKIKRHVSITPSTPEEISGTIKTFLEKEDLTPKNVLKLLEDEFGDVILSKNLPVEDKELIEQLRKSALAQSESIETIKATITPDNDNSESEKNKIDSPETEKKVSKPHHHSKIPKLRNKELENVAFGEKRRHSIDELDSWFSPKSEVAKIKRRREASLPNCLDSSNSTYVPLNTDVVKNEETQTKPQTNVDPVSSDTHPPGQPAVIVKIESKTNKKPDTGNEHSSLLKFLEMEKNNIFT